MAPKTPNKKVVASKTGSAKRKRTDGDVPKVTKKLKVEAENTSPPRSQTLNKDATIQELQRKNAELQRKLAAVQKNVTPKKKKPTTPSKRKSTRKLPSKSPSRREILQKRKEEKDAEPKWPARARFFKCWKRDFVFDLVREGLTKRGWTDMGDLCDPEDVDQLVYLAKQHVNPDTKKVEKLPRRCLWWVHEEDGRRLRNLPKEAMSTSRHCIGTFLGTDASVTKVAITECNNDEPWYPTAYILPKELDLLKKANKKKNTYWIAKPRDDYGGSGMRAYNGKQKEFKDLINNDKKAKTCVVQSYIPNPLLISGYKFHFRMYTILSGVLDRFECYLVKHGTALFSTEVFRNDDDTLGDNFDPYIHLTNWSINFTKKNLERLVKKKPFIGRGCETTLAEALRAIKKENPTFDVKDFWRQMEEICARCMYKIAQWTNVKKHRRENFERPRFENFGIDLMMDTDFKVWLLEANTQVGLNPGFEPFPDRNCKNPLCIINGCMECNGIKNVRYEKNNGVMRTAIAATIDLMQLDVPASRREEIIPKVIVPLHPLIDDELKARFQAIKTKKKAETPKKKVQPSGKTPTKRTKKVVPAETSG